ncbi:hypothetical protein U8607_20855 [Methylobacterium durans]|uniref:hypothetical protein n=1 Tax=Methylobacterium durans TaxID=2202825 RepID=UPI002AFEE552|nr:hypothetical protein [Methylobacterium durans]MEA1834548.1 hypothetical protein [Methylobacterium durans]
MRRSTSFLIRELLAVLLTAATALMSAPAIAADGPDVRWPSPEGRVFLTQPFAGSEIVLSASTRTAGAIDSLAWNGREFLNRFDHGRELQSAASFDGYGECFNPTEDRDPS